MNQQLIGWLHEAILATCAPEITGSHSYITALRRVPLHMHTFDQSDKLITFYCLQAANQRRSATMPSCKGARVGLACCMALLFALQTLLQYPTTSTR